MARKKLAPRRLIEKHQSHASRITTTHARKLTAAITPPTEIYTSVTGTRGEVLRLEEHKVGNVNTHVIILPGNPGVVEYYRPMLNALWRRLPRDVRLDTRLHAVGYPGHDVRGLSTEEYGIDAHAAYVQCYITKHAPEGRVVLLGHSYGSYLALRIAERLHERVAMMHVGFVMPALWRMGACAGVMLRLLLRDDFGFTSWLAWAASAFLAPIVRDGLIDAMRYRADVVDVTRALVDGRRRRLYRNICALGRDEIKCILEPADVSVVPRLRGQCLLVYCKSDRWCPDEGRRKIKKAFGEELREEYAGDGVSHGFVLFEHETEQVVKTLVPWICEIARGDSGESSRGDG